MSPVTKKNVTLWVKKQIAEEIIAPINGGLYECNLDPITCMEGDDDDDDDDGDYDYAPAA